MTTVDEAERTARRAANHPLLDRLTRMGLLGYGVTHLIVGWIALELAFGKKAAEGDQAGAFRTLTDQPAGNALMIAVSVGLIAMVVWQVLAAAVGHLDEQGRTRTLERVGSAFRALFYALLAWKAVSVALGSGKSSGDQQQQTTSTVLSAPGGRWIVAAAGVIIAGVGAGLVVYGLMRRFERHLKRGEMSPFDRKATRLLGIVGYAAKGAAYATVGVLVVVAAVRYDPGRSRGLDEALHTLAEQPAGGVILTGVAVGIAAYGVYCLYQARYRKV